MNLDQAQREILIEAEAGNSVLLVSGSGMGKSQMLAQTGHKLATGLWQGKNVGFGQIFAATQTPPDLIGYQFKGERVFEWNGEQKRVTVTEPSVPLWMISTEGKPAFMYDKFYLLIDEYGQGEADTKRGLAEIFLNKGTSPWYLPPGSVVVAATNEGSRYGVTKDFDFAIARRTLLRITPDVDVTVNHWDKPYIHDGREWLVQPWIKAWARQNPSILFEEEPKEQGPWCNPRTICAVGRSLQVREERYGAIDPNDGVLLENIAGKVGMPGATSMMSTLQFRIELPSYDMVVADPDKCPIPKKADLQMLMVYELAGNTKKEHLGECIRYISRSDEMPKDMAVTYVSALVRRDYNGFINEPAMAAWIAKNATLVSLIAGLSH